MRTPSAQETAGISVRMRCWRTNDSRAGAFPRAAAASADVSGVGDSSGSHAAWVDVEVVELGWAAYGGEAERDLGVAE